uniref:Uncharacterized protein n=1 Tax=Arundo donax TaxID=35708 RepID=A0A0A9AK88_ARUDO
MLCLAVYNCRRVSFTTVKTMHATAAHCLFSF